MIKMMLNTEIVEVQQKINLADDEHDIYCSSQSFQVASKAAYLGISKLHRSSCIEADILGSRGGFLLDSEQSKPQV